MNLTSNTPNCPKTGPVIDNDDVIIVGESTKQTMHQPSKKQETTQSTCNQNKPAKNVLAPGHEEVICRGHKTRGEDNDAGVEQGFSTQDTTDSPYDGTATDEKRVRTETHGKGPKRGQNKSQGAKRRF